MLLKCVSVSAAHSPSAFRKKYREKSCAPFLFRETETYNTYIYYERIYGILAQLDIIVNLFGLASRKTNVILLLFDFESGIIKSDFENEFLRELFNRK